MWQLGFEMDVCCVLTQDVKSRKLPTRLSTLVEKLELGLERLSCGADCVLLADNGFHVVFAHLGDDYGAENFADLTDQSCFNHMDGHLVYKPLERYLFW